MPTRIVHRPGTASPGKRSASSTAPAPARARGKRGRVPDTAPAPSASAAPDAAEIARLAYFYWESRGGCEGSAEEDWLRAERELRQRPSVTNI